MKTLPSLRLALVLTLAFSAGCGSQVPASNAPPPKAPSLQSQDPQERIRAAEAAEKRFGTGQAPKSPGGQP